MGIRQNAVALHNKTGSHARRNFAGTPWRFVVGLLECRLDPNQTFRDLCGLESGSKENTEEKK
jgi:hypothetical protein